LDRPPREAVFLFVPIILQCMSLLLALFVVRDVAAIWPLLVQQQTLIRSRVEWLGCV
jgi:hypothetical protein